MREDHVDYFGNPTTLLAIEQVHEHLTVESNSEISVVRSFTGNVENSEDWRDLSDLSGTGAKLQGGMDVWQFSAPSRHGRRLRQLADYAAASFPPGQPILAGCHDLMERIYTEFTFDPQATDVSSRVEDVLAAKRGVCQDFAHLMISALRSLGLPARYVSGYILTHPPEGQEKLQGADASHAWVSVWSPRHGWVEFDPTNNVIPRGEHIVFAYGRDYDDVSPISGVLLGGGAHSVDVAVDVVPLGGA
jgi:transglutaminase-like putative cysteine protease